jgi:hypothetical protein
LGFHARDKRAVNFRTIDPGRLLHRGRRTRRVSADGCARPTTCATLAKQRFILPSKP